MGQRRRPGRVIAHVVQDEDGNTHMLPQEDEEPEEDRDVEDEAAVHFLA